MQPFMTIRNGVVMDCKKRQRHVEIPAGVTGIDMEAFQRVQMRTITIRPGLREVAAFAFQDCRYLREVEFPAGVERIGAGAFAGCKSLQRVVLPDSLQEMAFNAFAGCGNLKTVEVSPDNPYWAQEGNLLWKRDSSVIIWLPGCPERTCQVPEGITRIPIHSFETDSLTEITLPASVEVIAEGAIKNCGKLSALHLSPGLRKIGESALAGCGELKNLALPETLEEIGNFAFEATGIQEMVLPASLRVLGTTPFRDSQISRLVVLGDLPEGMKSLSLKNLGIQFTDSFDLQADRIPMEKISGQTRIPVLRNFARRRSAGEPIPQETRQDRLEFLRRRQKELRWYPEFREVLLEERLVGAKEIDGFLEEALQREDGEVAARLLEYKEKHIDREEMARLEEKKLKKELRALTRPEPTLAELKKMWPGRLLEDGTWEIRGYGGLPDAFGDVTVPTSLKNIPVSGISASAFSPLVKGRRNTMKAALNTLKHVRVPEGIQVQEHAFRGCQSLEWVHLPEGMEELPEGIFAGCRKLKTVELPSTLKRIQAGCFVSCKSLERLEFPDGLEELGDEAFSGCGSLRSIRLPCSLRSVGRFTFNGCTGLKKVETDPSGCLEVLGERAFQNCSALQQIGTLGCVTVLPESVFSFCRSLSAFPVLPRLKRVGKQAFRSCEALEEVCLGQQMEYLGDEAFFSCRNLRRVRLSPSLREISGNAFEECERMESISFPPGLERIGFGAFRGCIALREVDFSGTCAEISAFSFKGCVGLVKVVLPPTQKVLFYSVFSGCRNLGSIVLPEGLETIRSGAFYECGGLREIVLPDSLRKIEEMAFPWQPELCFEASPLSYGYQWARKNGRKLRVKEPAQPR